MLTPGCTGTTDRVSPKKDWGIPGAEVKKKAYAGGSSWIGGSEWKCMLNHPPRGGQSKGDVVKM